MSHTRISTIPVLQPRPREGHKGTFGKVLIVAGSVGMSGAAILAGLAALRGGAGLVQLAVPFPIQPIVAAAQPCYMVVPLPADEAGRLADAALEIVLELAGRADAVVVGPGLGQNNSVAALVRACLNRLSLPLVVDADALNVLGVHPNELAARQAPFVLTPHPGEFARLIDSTPSLIGPHREELAQAFVQRHGGVLVLKGAGTVVCDTSRLYVNTTGNPGMATGGTGDVLAGLLGAFLAAGWNAFEAAVLGVHVHGLAGDLARDAVGETALIATDLLQMLPQALLACSASASGP
jgi:ADP-dependent NAD(P)H-hydrate dehydratase